MSEKVGSVEFIPKDEFTEPSPEVEREYPDPGGYSEEAEKCRELAGVAESGDGVSRVRLPREVDRRRVANAFEDAFELIGGVPRLALWADKHESAFYKLYARLAPTSAQSKVDVSGGIVVKHVLPRTELDEE